MSRQDFENVKFLHPIGASTLKYGVTIPVERMRAARCRSLFFSAQKSRLWPRYAALTTSQFRYENKAQECLCQYLMKVFGTLAEGSLLEVVEVAPFTFLFKPIPRAASLSLQISDILLHRLERAEMERVAEIGQIRESLAAVEYDAGFSQTDYNRRLTEQGWRSEQRTVEELGLKTASGSRLSSAMLVPITQDYVKFMLTRKYRNARLGLLLCPTTSFASLLCELGRQRARENVVRERAPVYSVMMSYEKAARELPFLRFMFEMPIVVTGVGVTGN